MIKGIKRKISFAVVLAMLLSMMIPSVAFGASFDYSGHWAEETIQKWFDKGKLKGYEDGSFRPNTQITRAEFMTMVNNAFEFTEETSINFSDVDSSDWYYSEVRKAVKAGYLEGYEDNTARPDNKITRQQAALMIARIKSLSDNAAGANKFNDAKEIAAWAKNGVGAVANAKYMIGYEDNTFRPLKFISRAEALVTIDRAMGGIEEEPAPSDNSSKPGKGGGGGGTSYTYAEIKNIEYNDGTTKAAIQLSGYAGEVTTTASAITITAITSTTSSAIEVTRITGAAIVSTSSSISADGKFEIVIELTAEESIIELTVTDPNKDKPRVYTITITKPKEQE